jgi:ribosome biogenesis GTPase / thiamine phosphate phosphatase
LCKTINIQKLMAPNDQLNPFLISLGWNDFFQHSFNENSGPGMFPGRIISQGKGHYHVQIGDQAVIEASITSKLRHETKTNLDFPGVGDWVVMTSGQGSKKANIHRVLHRKSLLQRKRVGAPQESQLLVTNVDFIFIVTSMNEDFDLQRLGRYLALSRESGATPLLLLTKADLCENPDIYVHPLKAEFGDVDVFKISSHDNASMDPLQKFFAPGMTSVLLGSSGVGKSTFTNYLLGTEFQKTQSLGGEAKGRHTTTSRNLFITRWGGLVIDTPGMQEVAALDSEDEKQSQFPDIEELMLQCKFTNCRHGSDPGCAISSSLKKGTLLPDRWNEFLKVPASSRGHNKSSVRR